MEAEVLDVVVLGDDDLVKHGEQRRHLRRLVRVRVRVGVRVRVRVRVKRRHLRRLRQLDEAARVRGATGRGERPRAASRAAPQTTAC